MLIGIVIGVIVGWLPILAILASCCYMSWRDRATTPPEAYFDYRPPAEPEPLVLREARSVVSACLVATDRRD